MNQAKPFMTIREACNYTGLSQRFIRNGCKNGTIPYIASGNVYMINVGLLMEKLNQMSLETQERSRNGSGENQASENRAAG